MDAADVVHACVENAVSIARTSMQAEAIVAHRRLPPTPRRRYGHHHGHDHGHFGGLASGHDHGQPDGVMAGHDHDHHGAPAEAARR